MKINWKDPSSALALLPAIALAGSAAVTSIVWPQVDADLTGQSQVWLMRAPSLLMFIPSALAGLGIITLLPRHKRMPIARASLLLVVAVALTYAWSEYARLATFAKQASDLNDLNRYIDKFVIASSVIGFLIVAFGARFSSHIPYRVRRITSGIIGDADWMDIDKAQRLYPHDGDIVLGEAYRVDKDITAETDFEAGDRTSWGQGGRAPLLCYRYGDDSGHLLFFAGPGGFKTTANVVPTGLTYRDPIVCFDPSIEIAPMLAKARRAMNHDRRILALDPSDPTIGFNVLDWIETSICKEEDIAVFAHMLLNESAKVDSSIGRYFQNQAHNLLTGVLAHILLSPNYKGDRTLRGLRHLMSLPDPAFLDKLNVIAHDWSEPRFVRETLVVFIHMPNETFSGVYSTASKDTQWLSLGNYAALVCGNSFSAADLADGKVDLFLNLRMDTLKSYPGIGRVIIGALLNAMIQANGRYDRRVLFLIDDASLLGYMKLLEEARDRGRKYGISLMLFYQSLGQVEEHFGPAGTQAWLESAAITSYAAVATHQTAKRVSDLCGEMTIEVGSSSQQSGLIERSTRALIMPHEILQDMRRDEQIIIKAGQKPLRCGRAIYFRRPDMLAKTGANRFAPK